MICLSLGSWQGFNFKIITLAWLLLQINKKIVDAQFLKVSEDKTTCSLRVIMSNQWVVRALLSDACKLKNSESTSYRGHSFDFSKTYISKDMTRSEQVEHKRLILELKDNILKDGNTRWVIKFGKVQAWGKFQRS